MRTKLRGKSTRKLRISNAASLVEIRARRVEELPVSQRVKTEEAITRVVREMKTKGQFHGAFSDLEALRMRLGLPS